MKKRLFVTLIAVMLLALMLSACQTTEDPTANWKVFQIEEEPAIDIQFRLPPKWYVDYAPVPDRPGEWDIALVPPYCAEDQEEEFADNCISLTVVIKGKGDFDPETFKTLVSKGITLNQSQTEESILISQDVEDVNGILMHHYHHKVMIGEDAVSLTIIFFETDSAYYYAMAEFPYDEENEAMDQYQLMIESISVIE